MTNENDIVNQENVQKTDRKEVGDASSISLKDIAKICQVSVSTVSKALKDRKDISQTKKEEIQRVAKELNYIPNYMAATLKSKRTYNIGVLFTEPTGLTHEHLTKVLNSFKDTVEEKGYFITFLNASNSSSRRSFLEQCKYLNFDGVFVLCADFRMPEVKELADSGLPIAVIDYVTAKNINVSSNAYGDMKRMLHLIYEQGHRKIAYIHGEHCDATKGRVKAYKEFMHEYGLPIPKEYLITCPYRNYERGSSLTKIVLSFSNRPTCIVYPDDLTAIAGLNVIQEAGLHIPNDISIVGYDGLDIANMVRPRITTVRQDTITMGIQAGNKLINRIEFPQDIQGAENVIVDGVVVPGESVSIIR